MEWPLPLWIVLEEESETLRRQRGLSADFSNLIDWEFARADLIDPASVIAGLTGRRNHLGMIALNALARFHLDALDAQLSADAQLTSAVALLNELLQVRELYQPFWDIADASWVRYVVRIRAPGSSPRRANRYLLESAFPASLRHIERFEANQIGDLRSLLEQIRAPERRSKLRELLEGLPNGPERATALNVVDPSIEGVNAHDVAVALNPARNQGSRQSLQ